VSGLLEIQRIADPDELACSSGVYYSLAYLGFLLPAALAGLSSEPQAQRTGWNKSKSGPPQGPTQFGGGAYPCGGYQPAGGAQSGGGAQPAGGIQPGAGYPLFQPGPHSGWFQFP
jgi:hypothetical protein